MNQLLFLLMILLVSTTETEGQKLSAPNNLAASDGTREQYILLNWQCPDKGVTFNIFRSDSPNPKSRQELKLTSEHPYGKKVLADSDKVYSGRMYYYWAQSQQTDKTSSFSLIDSGYLARPLKFATAESIAPVGGLAYTENVDFEWTKILGAENYRVQISLSSDWQLKNGFSSGVLLDTIVGQNFFNFASTKSDVEYFWTVQTLGREEKSYFSEPAAFDLSGENLYGNEIFSQDLSISDLVFSIEDDDLTVKFKGVNNSKSLIDDFKFLAYWSEDQQLDQADYMVGKIIGNYLISLRNEDYSYRLKKEKLPESNEGFLIIVPMINKTVLTENASIISLN